MATKTAAQFVMLCMHARTAAHVHHLQTRSYAAHVALQGFYEGLVGFVDAFAEAYIGEYGLIESYPTAGYKTGDTPMSFVNSFISWIETNREDICDSSHCQNVIDEIVALAYSTRYKLRVLR